MKTHVCFQYLPSTFTYSTHGEKSFEQDHFCLPVSILLCDMLPALWFTVVTVNMHSHVLWLPVKEYTAFCINGHHTTSGGYDLLSVCLHLKSDCVSAIIRVSYFFNSYFIMAPGLVNETERAHIFALREANMTTREISERTGHSMRFLFALFKRAKILQSGIILPGKSGSGHLCKTNYATDLLMKCVLKKPTYYSLAVIAGSSLSLGRCCHMYNSGALPKTPWPPILLPHQGTPPDSLHSPCSVGFCQPVQALDCS